MANYSHQSYPDSGNSSPLSREIDSENPSSWDEQPAGFNYKVKFMCSYGGKIQPRSHDNSLSYVGGDTKILSVERNTTFSAFMTKLSSICDAASASEICFKYQLPGEDLDALISVTNDEDLEHLMLESDRLNRSSPKPAKLRIFLFTVNSTANSESPKPDGSWFVDALNSVQYQSLENISPPQAANPEPSNPDFLFGFDNTMNYKVADPNPNSATEVGKGEQVDSIQNQMERMQKSFEEVNPHVNTSQMYQNDYYMVQEKVSPAPPQAVPVPISAGYWPDRQLNAGHISMADQQPVYMIQTPAGGVYYQNPPVQPVTGVYYREQPAYNAVPPPPSSLIQRQPPLPPAPTIVTTEQGYTQVRPMYYSNAGGGLAPPPQYQMVTSAAGAGGGYDGKVVGGKAPQTSTV